MTEPCIKCGGTEHYGKEVLVTDGTAFDLLPVGGFLRSPKLAIRVCGTCGFVEFRVPDRFMKKVREKFAKVS